MPNADVTQVAVEVPSQLTATPRVTQVAAEVLSRVTALCQVSQVVLEVPTLTGSVAASTVARGAALVLRWSDDGGHTWSNEYARDCGQAGQFKKRIRWLRLGRARDRIFEISTSDPVPIRVVDAYLEVQPGTGT